MKYSWLFFGCCLLAAVAIFWWPVSEDEGLEAAGSELTQQARSPAAQQNNRILYLGTRRWLDSIEESKDLFAKDVDANLQILDENGEVKAETLLELGLSSAQVQSVRRSVNSARSSMAKVFRSHLQADLKKSAPDQGIHAYFIAADRQAGDLIVEDLRGQLRDTCGEKNGELVLQNLRPFAQFGCFGRQELYLTMNRNEQSEIGYDIDMIGRDPGTGALVMKGRVSTASSLKFSLGEVLDLENK